MPAGEVGVPDVEGVPGCGDREQDVQAAAIGDPLVPHRVDHPLTGQDGEGDCDRVASAAPSRPRPRPVSGIIHRFRGMASPTIVPVQSDCFR